MKNLTLSTKIMITIFVMMLISVIVMGVVAGVSDNDNNGNSYEVETTESPF